MVSVERIKQFTNIPSEAAWEIKDRLPPPNWPARGNIDLKDLQVTGSPDYFLPSSRSVVHRQVNWLIASINHEEYSTKLLIYWNLS